MGGLLLIIWQTSLGICALLYNPALPYRNDIEQIPATLPINNSAFRIVLGAQDDIIRQKTI
jgi:hypothetical protein